MIPYNHDNFVANLYFNSIDPKNFLSSSAEIARANNLPLEEVEEAWGEAVEIAENLKHFCEEMFEAERAGHLTSPAKLVYEDSALNRNSAADARGRVYKLGENFYCGVVDTPDMDFEEVCSNEEDAKAFVITQIKHQIDNYNEFETSELKFYELDGEDKLDALREASGLYKEKFGSEITQEELEEGFDIDELFYIYKSDHDGLIVELK